MTDQLVPTDRTTLRRGAARGRFDRDLIHAVLDEALVCHLGFAVEGRPWVVPTIHARVGDDLYVHGATGNHALRALADGAEACVTVTLVDGLVLARSAFHHSMNYRSVMVFGRPARVEDHDEKRRALDAIVDHVARGRAADARPASPSELRATLVVRLPITEASAKVRTGPPVDEPEDMDLDVWAGVVPLRLVAGEPEPDPASPPRPVPGYAREWRRG